MITTLIFTTVISLVISAVTGFMGISNISCMFLAIAFAGFVGILAASTIINYVLGSASCVEYPSDTTSTIIYDLDRKGA